MSNPFADSLELVPRPSRQQQRFVLIIHVAAALVLMWLARPQPLLLIAFPVLACSLWVSVRRARLTTPRSVRRLVWRADGRWLLTRANGESAEARLRASSVALPHLVILHLSVPTARLPVAVVLSTDSLDSKLLRRLRARMKLSADMD